MSPFQNTESPIFRGAWWSHGL